MGMLPKNGLRSRLVAKLRIYAGPSHPHEAELPPDSAQCLLVEKERTFNDEVVEDEEEDDEIYLQWKREAEEEEAAERARKNS